MSYYEDLRPCSLQEFQQQALTAGYSVEKQRWQASGTRYIARDEQGTPRGVYAASRYMGRARVAEPFIASMLLVVAPLPK